MATKVQNTAIAEMMGQHISTLQISGLSVRAYCKDHNLSLHRFNYWRYKVKREQKSSSNNTRVFSRVKALTPGTSPATSSRLPSVEVTLSNGTRVAFFEPDSLNLFKALL